MFAQALNASEFRMMMDAYAVPEFMRRTLGGDLSQATKATWDQKCKEYYVAMGSPAHLTWMDIVIPFGISFDNAPVHRAYRKAALRPRVTVHEEFRTLFEHAVTGLNFNIDHELQIAFNTVKEEFQGTARRARLVKRKRAARRKARATDDMRRKYSAIDFYVKAQFQQFSSTKGKGQVMSDRELADLVFKHFSTAFENARAAYRIEHDVDWCTVFRREQAACDHRWLVFLPEQYMPLGNTTPDLHQTAEMLVANSKRDMRSWSTEQDPQAPALRFARNYDQVMRSKIEARNVKGPDGMSEDMRSIKESIRNCWVTCQVVAAEQAHRFTPAPFPDGSAQAVRPDEFGTGGRFPRKGRS